MTEDSTALTELPGWLPSLIRSLKLGYRAGPLLIAVAFGTTVAAAVPDALLALGFSMLGTNPAAALAMLAVLGVGGWLLATVSSRANRRFADRAAIVVEQHVACIQSTITTLEHHERPDVMDRISVLRDHAEALSELYQQLFWTLGALARLVITVGLLMAANPWFGLLGVIAVPTVLVSTWRSDAERRAEEAGAQHDRLAKHMFELGTTPGPAKEIRVFGVQDKIKDLRQRAWWRRHRTLSRARWRTAWWQAGAHALFGLAYLVAIASVVHQPTALLLVLAAGGRLAQYVANTVQTTQFFRTIWLDVSRRLAWLEDYAAAQRDAATQSPPDRLDTGIRLENVTFRYPGTTRTVLDDVTVTLPAGTTVAVVGENGAGKSTLVKLLCRLYSPTAGRILVDGVDLAAIDPQQWRQRVSGSFQDFFPFEYTAAESIGVGDLPRIDDPVALDAAAARAGGVPVPLPTQLGVTWENGVDLSHGQWQRVALARGFMRDEPLLLVLDEPTSALDAATEDALFERYARAKGPGVTVLVSHRLATVRMADLILVLDGSRLVECGSHAELMAADGRYAGLYRIQARAYGRTGS
ncbi:ABC transporter ATP-binding protein [Kutzneria sp. CA-103260]|uniref:ABC transporter ATP-binding protein n=1 Tax=Kutzneria sp. CA-103260 TaxID=2802641 RepID=UPI001BAB697E|nr:ABC transporter ATP-binding protein [Kutzneria sp. CA-103260]QUQ62409.1 ABC transporter ATPase/permease [Kutzneria sp. CA-103260]